ncbi:MAG: glycine hydroxymethyltransferase [Candidatus Vogelbacteria bacterium CG10_big_fil_rev_8_21_14_0_10_49_38]|uniref:Glycine hydroxymethyltransferase n=1 Tax=Candidatus Vogelbacteria bacterium CG10_big_fil_rev_8_21_14_0_10_49_38 TaxID=1975043 RepID=A0A2H0RIQ8_9BACT|nr:MAG: glycine hydroxymethyltransferase [bacterium CG10_49_38]PIR45914.1 MAG: glycine hydroxymethyltransferase [Candidatus Vogelbacteria bacterium CG10_big_fil_rev_8_21_14_0_10_49_38]
MDTNKDNFFSLLKLVEKHEAWMDETINLIASENKLSPLVNDVLKSDFGNRVAEGWIGERVFPGIKYYDEIEEYGIDLVRKMFKADFVDIRPISGTMANMIIFSAFTRPGDTIASISISSGAHISMAGTGPKKVFGLNVLELPFDQKNFVIDLEGSIKIIRENKPKMLVLGGSVILFSQPVKELVKVCKETGTIVLFDASHVAGLIATGLFPNPFDDGADIITMTVCKTIPGPQHAFILSRDEFAEKIKRTTFPGFLSGHHLHETVASVLSIEELKIFGKDYLKKVLLNAKALAGYLSDYGFTVLAKNKGFTETHMFLIDISSILPANEAELLLEKANIIVNRNMLPRDSSFLRPSGLRIGTPEITRIGAKEKDMAIIASFFKRLLVDKEDPDSIKKEVTEFRKLFKDIHYCYKNDR